MTEGEAKTKWCPFVRAIADLERDNSANRWPDNDENPSFGTSNMCIASECMAWRWSDFQIKDPYKDGKYNLQLSTTDGYCGLAGTP